MKNEIAVGILFTVALVILGYFTIMVKEEIFESREYYIMSARFPNVEGLESGDDVKVNGVKAGVVKNISLEGEHVCAYFKMYSTFPMFENYRIKIANESALGGKFISIYPGVRLSEGKIHHEVTEKTNLKGFSGDDPIALISDLIADNRESINATLRNIQQITGKINSGQGTLGKLVNQAQVYDNANDMVRDLRNTLEDVREQAPVTSFIRAALTAF